MRRMLLQSAPARAQTISVSCSTFPDFNIEGRQADMNEKDTRARKAKQGWKIDADTGRKVPLLDPMDYAALASRMAVRRSAIAACPLQDENDPARPKSVQRQRQRSRASSASAHSSSQTPTKFVAYHDNCETPSEDGDRSLSASERPQMIESYVEANTAQRIFQLPIRPPLGADIRFSFSRPEDLKVDASANLDGMTAMEQHDTVNSNIASRPVEYPEDEAIERRSLQTTIYDDFCKSFTVLRDAKHDSYPHRLARWAAAEAAKRVEEQILRLQETEAKLGNAIAEIERLKVNHENTLVSHEASYQEQKEARVRERCEKHDAMMADAIQRHRSELAKRDEAIAILKIDHRTAITAKMEELSSIERLHDKTMFRKDREYSLAISRKDQLIATNDRTYLRSISEKDKEIVRMNEEIEAKDEIIQTNRREGEVRLDELKQLHEDKFNRWQKASEETEITKLRHIEQLTCSHAKEIDDLKQKYEEEAEQRDRTHEKEVVDLNNQFRIAISKAAHEKQDVCYSHQEALKARDQKNADEIQRVIQAHEEEMALLREHMEAIQKEAEEEARLHEQNMRANNDQFASKFEAETRSLREQIEKLKEAFLTQDDDKYRGALFAPSALPGQTDEKIAAQFFEIQKMVEALSGITWKSDQRIWTEQVLTRVSNHSQEKLKRAILQDLAWTMLFHCVFCSPFRILGDEGDVLETQWNTQCGQSTDILAGDEVYTWPVASFQAERWRYMTMKECSDTLRTPLSEWDARARLKRGFKNSLGDLVGRLKGELLEIAYLGPEGSQLIQRLCKKAAIMWLEFTTYRCRIVINLAGSPERTMLEKVALVKDSWLSLTVLPKVGRYGDAMGTQLEAFTTIDGCAGEALTVP